VSGCLFCYTGWFSRAKINIRMGLKNLLEAIFVPSLEAEYLVFCVEQ